MTVDCFDRKPIEVHFEEIELTVKMPMDIDCYCMAIRALWVKHDHYSDCATSYAMPELPDEYESMYTTSKNGGIFFSFYTNPSPQMWLYRAKGQRVNFF